MMRNNELACEIMHKLSVHDEDFDYTPVVDRHADSVKSRIRVSNSRITGSFIIHMRKWSGCNARDVRARDI